jgi:ABC-type glycerol-3-phosphate transport system substrate-binding protein
VVQRAGFDTISGGIAGFTYWLYTNGGQLYNADQTKVAFNDAKGQATLQMMQDVQTKHGVRFGDGQEPPVAKGGTLFYQGYTAMTSLGTWSINYVTENVKELKWNMMAYPKGPAGKSQETTTWMNMVVMPKGIKNPELVWTFMAWFSSLDTQVNRMKIISRVAPRYDFFESKEFKEEAKKVKQLAEVPRIAELGGSYPFIRNGLFNKEVGPILNDAINGTLGVREALEQAEDKANQILAEAAAGR